MQGNVNIPDSTITTNLSFRQLILMNMQQLTNFPYIEKDFDALTDYELLSLVVKFLNDVIANQNEQNNSITRMYESFLALQTYVNNTKDTLETAFNNLDNYVRNYFDNLDVQEEINNKLDQMLEDGVLEQIIEQFIQSTAIWCFDSVTDMKLATNLINGSYARTLGYYSANDGGGATYQITNQESSTDYQEELESGLYANLIIEDVVYPEQFGAKGDNTTDDTAKLRNMFSSKANNYELNNEYLTSETIEINSKDNLNITGKGTIHLKRQQFLLGNWACLFFRDCSNLTVNGITFIKEVVDKSIVIQSEQRDYCVIIQPSTTIENKPLENINVENCSFIDLSGIPSMLSKSFYGELVIGSYENKTNNVFIKNNIFKNPCGRCLYLTETNNFNIEGNKLIDINYSEDEPVSTANEDFTMVVRVLACNNGVINNNYLHFNQTHVPSINYAFYINHNDKEYIPSKNVIVSNNIVDSELGVFTFAGVACCENVKYVNNKITFLPYAQGDRPYFIFVKTSSTAAPSQYAPNIVADATFESNEIKNFQRENIYIYDGYPSNTYGAMVFRNNTFWKPDAGSTIFYIGDNTWKAAIQMFGNILYRQNAYVGIIEKNTNIPDESA